ncbi:MAG: pyridoxamine 5'-phosphate oxidase [Gammaproteobacteria bacterium]|nr:pyridoxamine 5'-phosphate oxidase [Gammaproteobacteria bacterium]
MNLYEEAMQRFQTLYGKAENSGVEYPMAMSLATADSQGRSSVRTVLLKGIDNGGFVFYTNQQSRKGRQLAGNPYASLLFYWPPLKEQVEAEGAIETVTAAEADAYWATRPLESRIGAWASHQSEPLKSRKELEDRYAEYAAKFEDGNIPRPPHWSGYRLLPDYIEFWQEQPFRLHNRACYRKSNGEWMYTLLNP